MEEPYTFYCPLADGFVDKLSCKGCMDYKRCYKDELSKKQETTK